MLTPIRDNILDAIGDTPMVRINRITRGVTEATVLAKLETFNPGNSIKDRMAVRMIEDAERDGRLKPGGTIIEGTSGNTGMGLAIAAVVKGYKCIFTTTDKQSKEKVDALKAFGAEVIVCPTNVDPEDPRSYYSVSSRLEREVPELVEGEPVRQPVEHRGALRADRRPRSGSRPKAGSRIWWSASAPAARSAGVGRYLKERNPAIKVWGIDTYGSVFKKYKETGIFDKNEIYPYITEGIGEDFLPKNVDFSVIDHFEKVTDRDAALMTRRIAREEGIFAGNSAGSAMAGVLQLREHFTTGDLVVVIFHDHGSRYLGKMFNDEWMREKGFLERSGHHRARPRGIRRVGRALLARSDRDRSEARRAADERARLLADLDHQRSARWSARSTSRTCTSSSSGTPRSSAEPVERHHAAGVSASWTSRRTSTCWRR